MIYIIDLSGGVKDLDILMGAHNTIKESDKIIYYGWDEVIYTTGSLMKLVEKGCKFLQMPTKHTAPDNHLVCLSAEIGCLLGQEPKSEVTVISKKKKFQCLELASGRIKVWDEFPCECGEDDEDDEDGDDDDKPEADGKDDGEIDSKAKEEKEPASQGKQKSGRGAGSLIIV